MDSVQHKTNDKIYGKVALYGHNVLNFFNFRELVYAMFPDWNQWQLVHLSTDAESFDIVAFIFILLNVYIAYHRKCNVHCVDIFIYHAKQTTLTVVKIMQVSVMLYLIGLEFWPHIHWVNGTQYI